MERLQGAIMAELFEWNAATYGLEVPEMDSEHQVLIGYMNRLYELHQKNAPRSQPAGATPRCIRNVAPG